MAGRPTSSRHLKAIQDNRDARGKSGSARRRAPSRGGIAYPQFLVDQVREAQRSTQTTSMRCSFAVAIAAGMLFLPAQGPGADEAKPFPVDVWEPPFNHQRQHVHKQYVPLAHASKQWQLCALIPHLKDDYWLAVNSALIMEARRLGVRLNLFEAGGYEHLDTQKRQIAECLSKGSDGLIVGAISAEGLDDLIGSAAARGVPIVDLINGVNSKAIAARAAADFYDMGFAAGQALKKLARADGRPVRVAWFPGPQGAGWVAAGDAGFRAA